MMNTQNIISTNYTESRGKVFHAIDPSTGLPTGNEFTVAEPSFAGDALAAATRDFNAFKTISKKKRALFLRAIAAELELIAEKICATAMQESGLTAPRMQGELGRTTGQLRMFADLLDEGSWVDAIILTADPERKPLPRADIRRMLVPIGPVVVFGASNFPLAFSVAGGDTAAALAAGCPVIVKAHPAHPGTSALAGAAILNAVISCNMPSGVFSLLYDDGYEIGTQLVQHPQTKAVAFTGSLNGGMALHKLAQQRPEPIPVFAEMGSTNPVFLLPDALIENSASIADKYAGSVTNGAGQFCTKPGLIFALNTPALDRFKAEIAVAVANTNPATMLTPGIFENYRRLSAEALMEDNVKVIYAGEPHLGSNHNQADAIIAEVSAIDFINNPKLSEEVFGPFALLVVAENEEELLISAQLLQGQLTTTVMAAGNDTKRFIELIAELENKAGRLIFNGVPTGVEVNAAINHGGPFPATNNQHTSVGSTSVNRFLRPLAFQDWPDELLPEELKVANPLGIYRKINGVIGKA